MGRLGIIWRVCRRRQNHNWPGFVGRGPSAVVGGHSAYLLPILGGRGGFLPHRDGGGGVFPHREGGDFPH
jgi:hypothetical protein